MENYQVVISGAPLDDISREDAIGGLKKQFGLSDEKAEKFLSGKPRVIKKGIDKNKAQQYQKKFMKIGVDCTVKKEKEETLSDKSAAPPSTDSSPLKKKKAVAEKEESNDTDIPSADIITSSPDHPGYAFTIDGRPDYSFLTVQIPADETLKVEASAMATMDVNIKMKTKLKGGFGRFLTGESLFLNEFTAEGGPGEIGIAPGPPGDLINYYLDDDILYLQNSAFVASGMDINAETKWQGLTKGFFSGESLFLIRCSGTGDLWFNTYGAMIEIDVLDNYVVDTGHIVAFTDGLEYKVSKVGGYKSLFFSGEGFVCRFSGKGKVWIQTRMANSFISWVHPFRQVKKKG